MVDRVYLKKHTATCQRRHFTRYRKEAAATFFHQTGSNQGNLKYSDDRGSSFTGSRWDGSTYLRGHRHRQAPIGPLTRTNPGVRVHHAYIILVAAGQNPKQCDRAVTRGRDTLVNSSRHHHLLLLHHGRRRPPPAAAAQTERRTASSVSIAAGRDWLTTG